MNKKCRLSLTGVLLLILICALSLSGCQSSKESESARQIAEKSLTKMNDAKSYDMDLSMHMSMMLMGQNMDVAVQGTSTYFASPMKMKMSLNTTTIAPGYNGNEIIEQYIIAEGDTFTLYQKAGTGAPWTKMALNQAEVLENMQVDPAGNVKFFMDNLKEAKLEGEEVVNGLQTQKITLVISGDNFKKLLEEVDSMGLSEQIGTLTPEMVNQIGDLAYTIWVDKATSNMVKCAMDMTSVLQGVYEGMINNMPEFTTMSEEEKALVQEMVKSLSFTTDFTLKNFDQAKDFTLPAEIANMQ